jgi:orotate phosphoribosyltransferase-like protein
MKTKDKILKLKKEGMAVSEIAIELNISIQNVYKHLRVEKDKKEKLNRVVNLTDLDIERLSEKIYLKIISFLQ